MADQPYYMAYEARYQKAHGAGIAFWGHTPDDENLLQTLSEWVDKHRLRGKRVIEFACGEGASGKILSALGCVYHGVDIAPSAVEKTRDLLKPYPNAVVSLLDMVNDPVPGEYDAALDSMGLHMLVLDCDRQKYLRNAFACLKPGAPMLFYNQNYRANASGGVIESMEQWIAITGDDYVTPETRTDINTGIEVSIPLVPARARNEEDYIKEMTGAGFAVDAFVENEANKNITCSATIYAHKPPKG